MILSFTLVCSLHVFIAIQKSIYSDSGGDPTIQKNGQFKWCFGLSNCHWNLRWIVALKKAWIYMFDCYYIVTFELSKEMPLQRGLVLLTQWKTHHPPIILPFYILFPIHSADCWLIHFHSGYLIGSPVDEIIHILSPQCWNRCWIVALKKGLNLYVWLPLYIVTFELSKETPLQRGLVLLTRWKTRHPPFLHIIPHTFCGLLTHTFPLWLFDRFPSGWNCSNSISSMPFQKMCMNPMPVVSALSSSLSILKPTPKSMRLPVVKWKKCS